MGSKKTKQNKNTEIKADRAGGELKQLRRLDLWRESIKAERSEFGMEHEH